LLRPRSSGLEQGICRLAGYALEVELAKDWRHPLPQVRWRNEDRLGGNGVDDVADLLVVQQEIDELRDLNVINGESRARSHL
jgi:hypothetical protein